MSIETLSTFPGIFDAIMGTSIMKRAQEKGILAFKAHDLRDWTHDAHRTTDDDPYGGGPGLVMKCEPIFEAYDNVAGSLPAGDGIAASPSADVKPYTVFLSPVGEIFDDALAEELSRKSKLLFVCGHYEGIDERAYSLADRRISIGDYVLTGGELAALVVIDALVRKIPGVLGGADSALEESFQGGLLEYPHYTRPAVFRGMEVPEVLLSGNHKAIEEWRHAQRLERTRTFRSDLLEEFSDI